MGETGSIAATPVPGPGLELRAGAADAPAVSVALAPQLSVIALLLQAVSGQSWGAPSGLLSAVRGALRPQARFAAQPFTARDWTLIPESCTPIAPLADVSVADQVARMRDLPATALTGELQAASAAGPWPPHWRAVADQPRRWLNSMADASLDTWAVAEPRWRAAGPLLDREIRRVGTAAVRGGMAALLNSLHPRMSYRDGMFTVASPPCRRSGRTVATYGPVGPRPLALLPMIAGREALLLSFDRDDVCYIGYPIPPPGRSALGTADGALGTADGALATILGPVRAAILQALLQPLNVSGVAAAVHCAPTTATYHLHQLAAAGLISREKRGPSVRVTRTARGHELVDLLSG
jgi:DNA-binding transcriptional ArsR family regulator